MLPLLQLRGACLSNCMGDDHLSHRLICYVEKEEMKKVTNEMVIDQFMKKTTCKFDEQGPEIRTGFLKDGKPIQLKKGQEITLSTDNSIKGDDNMISMGYKKLPVDLKPGSVILCADGTISLTVLHCDKEQGLVRCRCENTAMLGERKNVNLPGVIVDLPTLTEKDKEDILKWGVPNKIDMIALYFVRKSSDLLEVKKVLGQHAKSTMLMSKVENQE